MNKNQINKNSRNAPALECEMEKNRIEVLYENIDNIEIKMFKIDLEAYILLNPFSKISVKQYTYTTPFSHEIINLYKNKKRVSYTLFIIYTIFIKFSFK